MSNTHYYDEAALVSTEWLAAHLNDPAIRVVESDEDTLLYDVGHIPGAVKIDWVQDLNDQTVRDYISAPQFAELMSGSGISRDTTVIFYGDKSNWWAAYAYWVFQLFGHNNAKLLNGGRKKWIDENRAMTRDTPKYPRTNYRVPRRDDSKIRALRNQVVKHVRTKGALVDVRSPQEFTGERLHMPDYPNEGALRGGHIPGAQSIPWALAVRDDGTFKSYDELNALYDSKGVTKDKDVVVYCRIGERSSHTWFVLTHLLGYPNVRNYDGSWTEWGNGVGLPIEKP
ncbi:MAG: sulfurtransferase [Chloroflexi bacterium]|nr:sulfurtransferase [Chloroflexota bacterium]MCL5274779.1 sulfurtransferase [Chloroflexota bacterium]